MATLWEELVTATRGSNELVLPWAPERSLPVADLLERAERTATQIRAEVPDPRRVGILMNNGEPFVRSVLAMFRLGGAAVPLALPVAFGGAEAYVAHLGRITTDASLGAILVDESTRAFADQLRSAMPDVVFLDVEEPPARALGPVDPVGDGSGADLAVIQYTSGSTSAPKGVALTHANVAAGLVPITGDWDWTPDDRIAIWLPLFHDMGLFSTLSALWQGTSVYLWRPTDFIRRTADWLVSFAEARVTVMPAPNFAFDYLVRVARDGVPEGVDLSAWRAAVNGAEPVQRSTVEAFTEAFAPYGFRPEAMQPVYGLAEATLAVSFPDHTSLPRFEEVERASLQEGSLVELAEPGSDGARSVAALGSAVTGIELQVGDRDGASLEDGRVGEIQIRGPAVMGGYLSKPDEGQPFTSDGWLRTGDLGFLLDGDLFVVGRVKDMVIMHGQNYYPEDVEEIVRKVPAVTRRHCCAVGLEVDGEDTMVVLFETALEAGEAAEAAEAVRRAVVAQVGLSAVRALPVAPRTIPHTPSGKVQRRAARELCREEVLQVTRRGWRAAEVI